MPELIAKVAVSGVSYAIDHTYDYAVPAVLCETLCEGMRVIVPFGMANRRTEAMVLELTESEHKGLKTIVSALDDEPVFSRELLRLALWVRERCFCTFYEATKAMLPSGLWFSLEDEYSLADRFDRAAALELAVSDEERRLVDFAAAKFRLEFAVKEIGPVAAKLVSGLYKRGILKKETSAARGVGDKLVKIYSLGVNRDEAEDYVRRKERAAPKRVAVMRFILENGEAAAGEIAYFTGVGIASVTALVKAGILNEESREVYRRPAYESYTAGSVTLNAEQASAVSRLNALAECEKAAATLLFGVTGSGKTQVYLEVIESALSRGRGAMILAPEIALTPQLMRVFRARFGDRVAILHSGLSAGERADEWKRIRAGEADVVLGTRSAVFAPLENIGVIVIDEEQERSYKSDSVPRYHARDVAKWRCAYSKALLVLGSATPSVESYHAASQGKYELITLEERYALQELPNVEIADMREELKRANPLSVSGLLRLRLAENIEKGEQSILFINRRGNSRRLVCGECGNSPECPNCSAPLTYHSANDRLMCHYCGTNRDTDEVCAVCGGEYKFVGFGTQKVEEDLKTLFPDIEILRMDSDTTSARRSHEQILSRFREEKVPILLGTQMVAKGLDFENVTLVGVLSGDQALYADDFRAHERAFSLITQVVGRAGRGEKKGRAVLQTYTPENPVLEAAARQDYISFFNEEIAIRERMESPPFRELVAVMVSGANEDGAMRAAFEAREHLRGIICENGLDIQVLGPVQASVFRINNRYRYHLLLNCTDTRDTRRAISAVIKNFKQNRLLRGYSIYADMSPGEF